MNRNFLMFVSVISILIAADAMSQQQAALVTTSGQGVIKAQPDVLRLSIGVIGQGKDVKEALAKLATERDAAKAKLDTLGAAADSVHVSEPGMGGGEGNSEDIRAQVMASMGRGQKKAAPTQGVQVMAMLEAEWPLKATSPEDRLVEGVELMTKIKAAFARTLTPQEQELQEEMAGSGMRSALPGEPRLTFVHVVTELEHAKALDDAMAQAKQSAQRLAKAAGTKLGTVKQLIEQASSGSSDGENDNPYTAYYAQLMSQNRGTSKSTNEATSNQPGPIVYTITVSAGFALD